jgi:hypothetical protein
MGLSKSQGRLRWSLAKPQHSPPGEHGALFMSGAQLNGGKENSIDCTRECSLRFFPSLPF